MSVQLARQMLMLPALGSPANCDTAAVR